MTVTAADIGRKAIELINVHGWTQGDYRNAKGEFCLRGATNEASRLLNDSSDGAFSHEPNRRELHKQISRLLYGNESGDGLVGWNDHHMRTKQEVLGILQAAVDTLEPPVTSVQELVDNLLKTKAELEKARAVVKAAVQDHDAAVTAVTKATEALEAKLRELGLADDLGL